MAKRYDEEEDDLDLDLEFDRKEYMKKEINKGKSTLIAVGLAPFFALVSMYVFSLTEVWIISLVMGMLGLIFLKPIYDRLNIDIDKIDKKGWLKNGGVYFMTLLAVWVILMNPPISDFSDPQVNDVEIQVMVEDQWIPQDEANITAGESYQIRVVAEITDNVDVDEESVMIEFEGEGPYNMNKTGDNLYEFKPNEDNYLFEPEESEGKVEYEISITMEDVNGNSNSENQLVSIEWK